ncbi:hypothetical protein KBC03_08165 [Patescibacteria group bacterium]|nr:hypothetical protein [Patescibacteria group bacterium]
MANQTTFKVGKLIRDKRYDNWVEKKRLISPPPSQTLVNSRKELINALHAKAAEEIEEAKRKCKDNNREEVLDELADVQQVVADLKTLQKEQDDDKTKAHENFIAQICSVFSIEIAEVITAQQRKEEKE